MPALLNSDLSSRAPCAAESCDLSVVLALRVWDTTCFDHGVMAAQKKSCRKVITCARTERRLLLREDKDFGSLYSHCQEKCRGEIDPLYDVRPVCSDRPPC